jgi:hypothetical protein
VFWKDYAKEVTAKAARAPTVVSENGFQKCIQKFYKHRQKCVTAKGNYFEWNAVQIDNLVLCNKPIPGIFEDAVKLRQQIHSHMKKLK